MNGGYIPIWEYVKRKKRRGGREAEEARKEQTGGDFDLLDLA
jgi:hypothetical protein